MLQANAVQPFLMASDMTRKSQEVLQQLLEELEHLDLTGWLFTEDVILQVAHGGNGGIYVAFCWIDDTKVKVALKHLRDYVYKDKDFAKMRFQWYAVTRPVLRLVSTPPVATEGNTYLVRALPPERAQALGIHS